MAEKGRKRMYLLHCMRCFPFRPSSPATETTTIDEEVGHEKGKGETNNGPAIVVAGRKPGGWKAMPYIIGNETFERLATFGMIANFTVYLVSHLHMKQVKAANLANIWFGTTNFAPLIGAYLSDAHFGRFLTLAFASVATFLGMVGLTLTAAVPALQPPDCSAAHGPPANCYGAGPSGSLLALLIVSLGLLTVGAGGIRPCSLPFGVDQFDVTTEKGQKGINSFFNWYYFTFTFSVMLALTAIVYVQTSISWALGLGIPAALMLVAIVLFFLGTRVYVYVPPEGSVFSGIGQVFVAAYRKRRLRLPSPTEEEKAGQPEMYDPPPTRFTVTKLPLTQQISFLNKAAIVEDGDLLPGGGGGGPRPANPWRLCSVQQVEELKCLIRIAPIWAAGVLCFVSMAQQGTFSVLQAMKMDRHLGPHFQIPPGSLAVISMLVITFFLPLYDRVLVPLAARLTGHEAGITLLQRMGIGMVLSVLSMVVAALVEKKRRAAALLHGGPGGVAPISVMWLAPQLALMGLAEAFNGIGQIEFYYKQFPEHMRSVAVSLFFCSIAGSSYLSSALMSIVRSQTRGGPGGHSWMEDDINLGRVDYFYYLIAAMGVLNLAYFLVCAHLYRYKGGETAGRSQDGGSAAVELEPQRQP
ncbi:hypothetical protein Taro_018597 [Colocasia esculenta]|uniref:Uncharacterized protein n=1 Tax=Colocasia esculenta TaxID=4460 RepID=A0A843UWN4_COLES|nr:hypothetical protein [Colocasia esculenta]